MIAHRTIAFSILLLPVGVFMNCDRTDPLEPPLRAAVASGPTSSSGAHAVAASESQIDVSWEDSSPNETGFEFHRSTTGPNGSFTLLATTAANVTSYSDSGLDAATEYCYEVRSFRTAGRRTSYSGFSTATCATTLPPAEPPEAPSSLIVRPWAGCMLLSWTDNSTNEAGFRVERSTDGVNWILAITTGADVTNAQEWWDIVETVVCYRVVAFNAAGDSPSSDSACTVLPAAPAPFTVTSVDEATFDLSWGDNSRFEDGYEVLGLYCDVGAEGFRSVAVLPADATSLRLTLAEVEAILGPPSVLPDQEPYGQYSLQVQALKGAHGSSVPSEVVLLSPYPYEDCFPFSY